MGAVVDEDVLCFDGRILGRDVLEGALKHSFGELEDVGLGGAVDPLAPRRHGKLERQLDDLLAAAA